MKCKSVGGERAGWQSVVVKWTVCVLFLNLGCRAARDCWDDFFPQM